MLSRCPRYALRGALRGPGGRGGVPARSAATAAHRSECRPGLGRPPNSGSGGADAVARAPAAAGDPHHPLGRRLIAFRDRRTRTGRGRRWWIGPCRLALSGEPENRRGPDWFAESGGHLPSGHPWSSRTQSAQCLPGPAARLADRLQRPVRIREVQPCLRHHLRRGAAALCGESVGVRPSVPRTDGQAGCGLHRRPQSRGVHRPEVHQSQSPVHGGHRHRGL